MIKCPFCLKELLNKKVINLINYYLFIVVLFEIISFN